MNTSQSPRVLVIGASGTTGSRVSALLRQGGARVRDATRTPNASEPSVRFEWADQSTYGSALAAIDTVYLVAPGDVTAGDIDEFCSVAELEGVKRVILLSSSSVDPEGNGADHPLAGIVRSVRGAFAEVAVLRPSWFMSNIVGRTPLARSIRERSLIASATGDARVAFIDPDDIANVAAHLILQGPRFRSGDYILTGPAALTFAEVATELSVTTGRTIDFAPMGTDEFADFLVDAGVPESAAGQLARLDITVSAGSEDRTTDTVERITGRLPRSYSDYIRRNREQLLAPVEAIVPRQESSARDTLVRMAWAVDRGDWSGLHEFFEDEVLLDYSRAFGTRQRVHRSALVENWRDRLDPLHARQHAVTGAFSDESGDQATVRANVLVTLVARPGESTRDSVTHNGGAWKAAMRQHEGVWRIHEFTAEALWTDGAESALMAEGPEGVSAA